MGIFEKENATVCYVELEANLEVRLKRNKSINRLKHKPSKRNYIASEEELLKTDRKHILNFNKNEFKRKNYLKINNDRLNAHKAAKIIKEMFSL